MAHLCLATEVGKTDELQRAMDRFDAHGHFFERRFARTSHPQDGVSGALRDASASTASQEAAAAISSYEDDDAVADSDGFDETRRDDEDEGSVGAGTASLIWREVPLISISGEDSLPFGFRRVRRDLLAHQERSLKRLHEWWSSSSSAGVLCLPTGAGKTRTAVSFVLRYALAQGGVLWLTHRVELMNQAVAAFIETSHERKGALTVGRFGSGTQKVRQRVDIVVASIPTLARGRKTPRSNLRQLLKVQKRFALVVVDECHHGAATSWRGLLEELNELDPQVRTLGLSATPTRGNDDERRALWRLLGEMVHEEPALDLIRQGILATPTLHPVATASSFELTEKERKYFDTFEEYAPSLLDRIAEDQARNALIVRTYTDSAERWGQTLIFAAKVSHGQRLTQILREKGVAVCDVYASTTAVERARVIDGFGTRRVRVVVNVGLFTEGTDMPGVETLFLARPTNSRVLFQQMVGRGMRGPKVGGSERCQIVAFHDNVIGMAHQKLSSTFTDEREAILALGLASLDSRSPRAEDASHEEDDTDEAPVSASQVAQAESAVLRMLLDAVTGVQVADMPLRGWWLARDGRRKAFLPVFYGEEAATRAYVDSLANAGDPATVAALVAWGEAGEVVLASFSRVARRQTSTVEYHDASTVDLLAHRHECADGVSAQVARLSHEPLPYWWTIAELPDGTAHDSVAFHVDGDVMVVDHGTAAAVEAVWERKQARLRKWAVRNDLESNLPMMVNLAVKWGADLSSAKALLRIASLHGAMPPRASRDSEEPDPASVVAVLESVSLADWPRVLDAAAEVLMPAAHVLPDEFLVDILYAVGNKTSR